MVVIMNYTIEVYDTLGRRAAVFHETPLLDVIRRGPDEADRIEGLLPKEIATLGHRFRLRVLVEGAPFCAGWVNVVRPQWSDTKKLILDKYVSFHEVVAVEADGEAAFGNTSVSRIYSGREIGEIVKDLIQSAPGSLHYTLAHAAYPEGAAREYGKFLTRKAPETELAHGGIAQGNWVGAPRLDASAAYAKDGDTIAGVKVDGAAWPELRLLNIDAEERERNGQAIARHPEVRDWSDAQYAASGYKQRAEAATAFLQGLIDARGIDFIELNPHLNTAGEFDDRVDAYGRYVAMVYGGGQCFNAAMVEQGHADVYLYEDGAYHAPEMALKDFYSYAGVHGDSVTATCVYLDLFEAKGGLLEMLTALAYMAEEFVFSVDLDGTVRFRRVNQADRTLFFAPTVLGVQLGSDSNAIRNVLNFTGNPAGFVANRTFTQQESVGAFGVRADDLEFHAVHEQSDAERLMAGLLPDLGYPEAIGVLTFFRGDASIRVGEIVEVRGAPLRRLEAQFSEQWHYRFWDRLAGRVRMVRHRFSGNAVTTTAYLTSPYRSVRDPLAFMVQSQETVAEMYAFRLDDAAVGLDMGYHLD
jgi:endonuclease YncB( thermonuclease family)